MLILLILSTRVYRINVQYIIHNIEIYTLKYSLLYAAEYPYLNVHDFGNIILYSFCHLPKCVIKYHYTAEAVYVYIYTIQGV